MGRGGGEFTVCDVVSVEELPPLVAPGGGGRGVKTLISQGQRLTTKCKIINYGFH